MHKRHGAEREGGNGMKLEQNGTDQNTHMERFTVGLGRAYNLRARVGLGLFRALYKKNSGFFGPP